MHELRSGEGAQVAELVLRFGVSQMTVRRDLARLAVEGKLTRVHGGAVGDAEEPPFGVIAVERAEAKGLIGRAAATMVEDGQAVMLDVGTTTLALAARSATRREREDHYFSEVRAAAGVAAGHDSDPDAGGYENEAIAVVEAIAHDRARVLVVDTANRGALPFLDDGAVVELPCVVSRTGAVSLPVADVPPHCRDLMSRVRQVERLTIAAAVEPSPELAVRALALRALIPDEATARGILASSAAQQPELGGWAVAGTAGAREGGTAGAREGGTAGAREGGTS